MKKIPFLLVAAIAMTAHAANNLHPADAYDIKSAAESAVWRQTIKAGEPRQVSGGYEVPVAVSGKVCKVMVKPYKPTDSMEPPVRWKVAEKPSCGQ